MEIDIESLLHQLELEEAASSSSSIPLPQLPSSPPTPKAVKAPIPVDDLEDTQSFFISQRPSGVEELLDQLEKELEREIRETENKAVEPEKEIPISPEVKKTLPKEVIEWLEQENLGHFKELFLQQQLFSLGVISILDEKYFRCTYFFSLLNRELILEM